jgi:hypothetical protein
MVTSCHGLPSHAYVFHNYFSPIYFINSNFVFHVFSSFVLGDMDMCFPQCESVHHLLGLTGILRSPGEVNLQFAPATRSRLRFVSSIRLSVYSPTYLFFVQCIVA